MVQRRLSNQSMELTASRRTIQLCMSSAVNPLRRTPPLAAAHLLLVRPMSLRARCFAVALLFCAARGLLVSGDQTDHLVPLQHETGESAVSPADS